MIGASAMFVLAPVERKKLDIRRWLSAQKVAAVVDLKQCILP